MCMFSVCVIPCKNVGCVGSVGMFILSVLKRMSTNAFITKQFRDTFLEDICCIFDTKALLPETDSVLRSARLSVKSSGTQQMVKL